VPLTVSPHRLGLRASSEGWWLALALGQACIGNFSGKLVVGLVFDLLDSSF